MPMHPPEYPLLGFSWKNKFYINSTLCMGLSTSCVRFEAFSSAIQWAVQQKFPEGTISHLLDDFLIAGPSHSSLCLDTLNYLLDICSDVNIPVKHQKTVMPCTQLVAHGLEIDSQQFEIRLPQDKLDKCRTALRSIIAKRSATLHEFQQLHGLLNFSCRAITPGRPFLRRLCDAMSGVQHLHHFLRITSGIRADLQLWLSFLDDHNGVTMFRDSSWSSPAITLFYSDASGSIGYGAYKGDDWFAGLWPTSWSEVDKSRKYSQFFWDSNFMACLSRIKN